MAIEGDSSAQEAAAVALGRVDSGRLDKHLEF